MRERFPDDSILGEEFGAAVGTSGYQWVLDPIDGTKSFIHGVPLYTTLVAVLADDQPKVGIIYAPACREMVFAQVGGGCWYCDTNRDDVGAHAGARLQRAAAARVACCSPPRSPASARRVARTPPTFISSCSVPRGSLATWGDGYGYMMVATGRAEVMIDPVVNLWDAAPLQTIIEEAGGRFTDWQGKPTVHAGEAIATNGLVTDEVLAITRNR